MSLLTDGWRLIRGVRRVIPHAITPQEARTEVEQDWRSRETRFLSKLDASVWSDPSSPYKHLFKHAGVKQGDVTALVGKHGLEETLGILRDEGVYVAYEEYTGQSSAQRGSVTFHFRPEDFFSPMAKADLMLRTSGTRSSGTPVAFSFSAMRRTAVDFVLRDSLWGVAGSPGAMWFPVLPSSGFFAVLMRAKSGRIPRWFTQIHPTSGTSLKKRAANQLLFVVGSLALGAPFPRPRFASPAEPDVVLDWCRQILPARKKVFISGYTSSIVALAQRARERGVSLDGLVAVAAGEPLSASKATTIRASGAAAVNAYGSTQLGSVGLQCPACGYEDFHLAEHEVSVVTRSRTRPDGARVDALLWTHLAQDQSVFINVENDDYGVVSSDDQPCSCVVGRMGFRTRLRDIRGISKVVTGGATISGEIIEELVDQVLPQRFGGSSADFQFVESDDGQTRLTLRIDPRLGGLDEQAAIDTVHDHLRKTDPGYLASEVWSKSDTLRIERTAPKMARSGKMLPFERLS